MCRLNISVEMEKPAQLLSAYMHNYTKIFIDNLMEICPSRIHVYTDAVFILNNTWAKLIN